MFAATGKQRTDAAERSASQNLLNANYADVGIGIAPAEYGYYFIADLGSR